MTKYFNLDNPAPFVSARSWIVTNIETGELLFAKRENEKRQCASLTKIMTFMVVNRMCEQLGLNTDHVRVRILDSSTTSQLGGTSAVLIKGDS